MDAELEAAIDRAGRDRVFARAVSLGWSRRSPPPKWVWWGIVNEVTAPETERDQNGLHA